VGLLFDDDMLKELPGFILPYQLISGYRCILKLNKPKKVLNEAVT